MTLEQLRDRLKAATGPDRALDALVHGAATFPGDEWRIAPTADTGDYRAFKGDAFMILTAPRLTASLDAAVTLVPEGWGCRVTLAPTPRVEMWSPDGGPLSAETNIPARGATPALALCLARVEYEIAKARNA